MHCRIKLRARGFNDSTTSGEPICTMHLAGMRVDIMPDSEVLGFVNRWYERAWLTAETFRLTERISIRLVTPAYFLATKLEAFRGRGEADLLGSKDIEDVMTLLDGREELPSELGDADPELLAFVASEFRALKTHKDFEYLIQDTTRDQPGREEVLLERMQSVIERAGLL